MVRSVSAPPADTRRMSTPLTRRLGTACHVVISSAIAVVVGVHTTPTYGMDVARYGDTLWSLHRAGVEARRSAGRALES